MHDVIFLEGSQPINITHLKKKIYFVFFYLVTIQIVFLPTIGTGTPIYVFSNIHELFSWLCILTYFLYIYQLWSVKNARPYYFQGISLSHYIFLMCIMFVFIYLTYIYNLLMSFFFLFLSLRLALNGNSIMLSSLLYFFLFCFFFF